MQNMVPRSAGSRKQHLDGHTLARNNAHVTVEIPSAPLVSRPGRGRRSSFPEDFLIVLRNKVRADPNFMPRHGLALLVQHGSESGLIPAVPIPSDEAVRR